MMTQLSWRKAPTPRPVAAVHALSHAHPMLQVQTFALFGYLLRFELFDGYADVGVFGDDHIIPSDKERRAHGNRIEGEFRLIGYT